MWRMLFLPDWHIVTKTTKAILVQLPTSSEYAGYAFWYPKALTKRHLDYIELRIPDDFEFNVKRFGKRYKSDTSLETLTVDELLDIFENERNKKIHKPKPLKPEEAKVLEELLYDD